MTARGLALVPVVTALVAEAAWTTVVAGLLAAFAFREPTVGIPTTLAAAIAGAVAARTLGPRMGEGWPWAAVGLALAAGRLAWFGAPDVRSILADRGLDGAGEALLANPGA